MVILAAVLVLPSTAARISRKGLIKHIKAKKMYMSDSVHVIWVLESHPPGLNSTTKSKNHHSNRNNTRPFTCGGLESRQLKESGELKLERWNSRQHVKRANLRLKLLQSTFDLTAVHFIVLHSYQKSC